MKINLRKVIVIMAILAAGSMAISGFSRVFAETKTLSDSVSVTNDPGQNLKKANKNKTIFFDDAKGNKASDRLDFILISSDDKTKNQWNFIIPVVCKHGTLKDHLNGNLKAKIVGSSSKSLETEIEICKTKNPKGVEQKSLLFKYLQSDLPDGDYEVEIYDGEQSLGKFKNVKLVSSDYFYENENCCPKLVDVNGKETSNVLLIDSFKRNGVETYFFNVPLNEPSFFNKHENSGLVAKVVSNGKVILEKSIEYRNQVEVPNLAFEMEASVLNDGVYDFEIYADGKCIGKFLNVQIKKDDFFNR